MTAHTEIFVSKKRDFMQLVLNTYGSYLKKKGECFEIKVDDKKQEISARKVQSILITTAVLVSTDAILLAHENNVDIVFLDKYGNPFSRVWHSKFGSTTYIRRKQLEYSGDRNGLDLAKDWILNKIANQMDLLTRLKKTRENKRGEIEDFISGIQQQHNKLAKLKGDTIDDVRGKIFAYEAQAGKIFFQAVSFILPEKYRFSGRSRNPAKDEFNAFLNYGYGILYSRIERACVIAGLDPFIGFLHTDNYGKKSFVFDVIELFRIHIDEVVVKLFSKRMIKQDMFEIKKNGIMLGQEGKKLLISEHNKNMEETTKYRNRNIKKNDIMQFECHGIANNLIGKNKDVGLDDL